NAGKLTAAACRRATSWRPEIFLRCRGLGRISRRNGCTVRILQGAWRPSEGAAIISGNQTQGRTARNALPAGRSRSRANGSHAISITVTDTEGRHRWTTRDRILGKVHLEAAACGSGVTRTGAPQEGVASRDWWNPQRDDADRHSMSKASKI